jgi:hypothetical protein
LLTIIGLLQWMVWSVQLRSLRTSNFQRKHCRIHEVSPASGYVML